MIFSKLDKGILYNGGGILSYTQFLIKTSALYQGLLLETQPGLSWTPLLIWRFAFPFVSVFAVFLP